MATSEKKFKRGEVIVQEGRPLNSLYFIKSGKVSVVLEKSGGKKIEVEQLTTSQVIGEQAILGSPKYALSAVADSEVRVTEVPAKLVTAQFNGAPPILKLLMKSVVEGLKSIRSVVKNHRLEQDPNPFPQLVIPKMFSILYLVAHHVGQENDKGEKTLAWGALKLYVNRMFLESHTRIEGILLFLSKLGHVSLSYRKSDEEDGEDELAEIAFHDLQVLEDFCEFYQYNLFKGGKAEVIFIDTLAMQVAHAFNHFAREMDPDRKGAVRLDYNQLLKDIKSIFRFDLRDTHLNALERKGLFVKRQALDEGVYISFDKAEFANIYRFWEIINEIDKWNENGRVDVNEKLEDIPDAVPSCSQCNTEYPEDMPNFCSNCGFKMVA